MPAVKDLANKDHQKKFRQFLQRADKNKVLKHLPVLHEEAFKKIDCLSCAACCKNYSPRFKTPDIKRISKHLKMRESDFIDMFITQQPLELPSEEKFHTGLKMITYQHQRQLPYIKTIDYLMAIWLQPLLKQKKVDDVLYHQNSIITECPRSNFFLINYDNSILTPADDILPGITRKNLLKLSNEFNIKEKKITIAEIKKAKSAFISSTSKIVLPVHQVDEVIFQEHDLIKDIKEAFCSIYSISA
jgi:branched-subunit amino acid aminotransferase/4-amino-4-deoxychorismate lyase